MNLQAYLILLSVLSFAQLSSCSGETCTEWLSVKTQRCLPEALAIQRRQVPHNQLMCVGSANSLSGLLVVQFDSATRQCLIFRFIDVCHLIDALASNGISELHSCAAFINGRAANFMSLSRKLANNVGSNLRAAWVMSNDEEASVSNLVCGFTQRWKPNGLVDWSAEGVKFSGTWPYLHLPQAEFDEVASSGLTVLVRMRMGDFNVAMDNYKCDTGAIQYRLQTAIQRENSTAVTLFVEFDWAKEVSGFDKVLFRGSFRSAGIFELAVVAPSRNVSQAYFVYNSASLPQSRYIYAVDGRPFAMFSSQSICYTYWSQNNSTLRAIAILNSTLTVAEISKVFSQLP